MKNHLYLYTSKLENVALLREDPSFKGVIRYNHKEVANLLQNEVGYLEGKLNIYHIIIGNLIEKDGCPWCGTEPYVEKEKHHPGVQEKIILYMKCPQCFSQGPRLFMNPFMEENEEFEKHLVSLLNQNYYYMRRPWDANLYNPYGRPWDSKQEEKSDE